MKADNNINERAAKNNNDRRSFCNLTGIHL
jgi:hypothetical protein